MVSYPFACLVIASLGAHPLQELTGVERQGIAALCAPWDRDDAPGLSIAIARGGEVVLAEGFGLAQMEYEVPIDPDTVFHVASVSKQFTAFAIVLLEQEGVLSLDDDVREHVPWLHDFGATITIRHLLSHTSGLRDQWELLAMSGYRLDDVLTREHVLEILRHQRELNFAPGSEFMYSNTNFSLAAEIVSSVSERTFADFCRERIFEPLGMRRTHFHTDYRHIVPRRAYSYAARDGGWEKRVLNYASVGATGLFATAPDLTLWLMNLGTGELGGRKAIDALCTPGRLNDGEEISYALGIIAGTYRGQRTLRHSGGDAGFRSEAIYFPDSDLAIAVLANAGDDSPQRIADGVADRLLADRLAPVTAHGPERVPIDGATLERMLGRYGAEDMPDVVVSRDADAAFVEIIGEGNGELHRASETDFFVREAPISFRFEFPEDQSEPATALIVIEGDRRRRGERIPNPTGDPGTQEGWSGRYFCPELEVFYEIVVQGERVFARHRRHGEIPLTPVSEDVLAGDMFFFRKVAFEREGGEVIGFRLSGSRALDMRFTKSE